MKSCIKTAYLWQSGESNHERAYASDIMWLVQGGERVEVFKIHENVLGQDQTFPIVFPAMHDAVCNCLNGRQIMLCLQQGREPFKRCFKCVLACCGQSLARFLAIECVAEFGLPLRLQSLNGACQDARANFSLRDGKQGEF